MRRGARHIRPPPLRARARALSFNHTTRARARGGGREGRCEGRRGRGLNARAAVAAVAAAATPSRRLASGDPVGARERRRRRRGRRPLTDRATRHPRQVPCEGKGGVEGGRSPRLGVGLAAPEPPPPPPPAAPRQGLAPPFPHTHPGAPRRGPAPHAGYPSPPARHGPLPPGPRSPSQHPVPAATLSPPSPPPRPPRPGSSLSAAGPVRARAPGAVHAPGLPAGRWGGGPPGWGGGRTRLRFAACPRLGAGGLAAGRVEGPREPRREVGGHAGGLRSAAPPASHCISPAVGRRAR